jgi:hypothetical protein
VFCVNCGKTVPSDAQFCINCGSSVPEAAHATTTLEATEGGSSWSSEPLASTPSYSSGPVGAIGMPEQTGLTPVTTISTNLPPLPSGNDPGMLDKLPSFNVGAFLLTPLWSAFHGLWALAIISFFFGGFCWPIISIVAGLMGNKEAWKRRRFASYQEFLDVQRKWMIGGIAVTAAIFLFFGGIFMLAILASAAGSH